MWNLGFSKWGFIVAVKMADWKLDRCWQFVIDLKRPKIVAGRRLY
jgi:hypothetical protein